MLNALMTKTKRRPSCHPEGTPEGPCIEHTSPMLRQYTHHNKSAV